MNASFHSRIFPVLALAGALLAAQPATAVDFKVDPGTGLSSEPSKESSKGATKRNSQKEDEAEVRRATEITATEETSFDERARVATFIGNVKVKDTEFTLTCDKLTAHLRKASQEKEGAGGEKKEEGGGLERAIAQGNVLIVQEKVDAKGEVTRYVGRAARAEYVAATGEVTLTGWPQIQQGINNQVATEEGTVMILNRNGRLRTIGPSKTEIKESSDPTKTTRNGR